MGTSTPSILYIRYLYPLILSQNTTRYNLPHHSTSPFSSLSPFLHTIVSMASPFGVLVCLLIVLPQIQATSIPYNVTVPLQGCQIPYTTEVNLHLFLHQFVDGPNNPNRNEETLLQASFPFGFGTTIVHDWTLTETTNSRDTVVARVQGVHVQAGLTKPNRWYTTHNIEFQQGR